jgi:hypothetical protein
MTIDKCREALQAAYEAGVPSAVWQASMCAEDNAGGTLIDQGRKQDRFIEGTSIFSDEMVTFWYYSIQGIMSESDCDSVVREFFAKFGIIA